MLKPPVGAHDHVIGKGTGLVLVEYGDFECPYCGEAYPVVKNIKDTMQVTVAFRHFPLKHSHPHAFEAALAAEAASLQGKFWEMHDIMYENQSDLSSENLHAMAQNIGLDLGAFSRAMKDEAVHKKVASDFESGLRSGVNGTPTFFVNGERYDGDVASLAEYLEGVAEEAPVPARAEAKRSMLEDMEALGQAMRKRMGGAPVQGKAVTRIPMRKTGGKAAGKAAGKAKTAGARSAVARKGKAGKAGKTAGKARGSASSRVPAGRKSASAAKAATKVAKGRPIKAHRKTAVSSSRRKKAR